MRRAALLLALTLVGCGGDSFQGDKVEEYRYLKKLANPTPEQSARLKELRDMPDVRRGVVRAETRERAGSK
jgi:hypothetical protein